MVGDERLEAERGREGERWGRWNCVFAYARDVAQRRDGAQVY